MTRVQKSLCYVYTQFLLFATQFLQTGLVSSHYRKYMCQHGKQREGDHCHIGATFVFRWRHVTHPNFVLLCGIFAEELVGDGSVCGTEAGAAII